MQQNINELVIKNRVKLQNFKYLNEIHYNLVKHEKNVYS